MHRTKVRVATDALDANDTIAAANRAAREASAVRQSAAVKLRRSRNSPLAPYSTCTT